MSRKYDKLSSLYTRETGWFLLILNIYHKTRSVLTLQILIYQINLYPQTKLKNPNLQN